MSKPHYPILDGLRGTAALLVVIFHLFEAYTPDLTKHPMHHGYLAVDFFYLLSGFVVGYAYDDRWAKGMTIKQFLKIRFIRLHPLVILGTVIGAICFWLDPYKSPQIIDMGKFAIVFLVGLTMLPAPTDVRGWGETHPLDGPCWSLMQEYIANILYAIIGRKLNKAALWAVVIISGIILLIVSVDHGDLGTGWGYANIQSKFIADFFHSGTPENPGYPNIWVAPVRMMFPFFAGLLLFRTGKMIKVPMAYTLCSLLLAALFFFPYYSWNGYYDALCVIIFFPIIVAAGAGGQIGGRWAKLCKFSGDISYPIYITHYPFIYIYTFWIGSAKPNPSTIVMVACGLFLFIIALGYAALKLYDEPVRKWLKAKLG